MKPTTNGIRDDVKPEDLLYTVTLVVYDDVENRISGRVSRVTANELAILMNRADSDEAFWFSTLSFLPEKLRKWVRKISESIGLTLDDLIPMYPPEKKKRG